MAGIMGLSQAIYDYIRRCPLIDADTHLGFNQLGTSPQEFSIENKPENPIIRRYMDSTVREKVFYLVSRESYTPDERINIANSAFYEDFCDWIEKQNRIMNFPDLGENQEVIKIECITAGYPESTEEDTAKYCIQLKLTYIKKGER